MSDGLNYFKEVYGVVPEWVRKMHNYRPEALDHYTNLRSTIMQDGALSTKDKDLLLVGINAARCYERSMVYHTKGAIDGGATVLELAEFLLVPYVYGGSKSVQTGIQALRYALSLQGTPNEHLSDYASMDELLSYLLSISKDEDTSFIRDVLGMVGDRRKELLLESGIVGSEMKAMLMVGIYCAELQGFESAEWFERARALGATEDELVEVGLICLLTAGIPAWFETSDWLTVGG